MKFPMSVIPLQYVLLFAIAISQIFGGISCCCLGRTFFSSTATTGAAAIGELSGNKSAVASSPSRKCPKCSARQSGRASVKDSASTRSKSCSQVSDDGQCRCQKLALSANASKDAVTVDYKAFAHSLSALVSAPKHAVVAMELRRFGVPIRFGGHSWQSIACVWKN